MSQPNHLSFSKRHIGVSDNELNEMLQILGVSSLDELISETIPDSILRKDEIDVPAEISEFDYLRHIKEIGSHNSVYRSYIGQGYYGTITPSAILRNIFENPGWYTQYTPYQAEISQGRLEALLNYQTMVSDLTGLPLANASLLDEATAAAEAMSMFFSSFNKRRKKDPATIFFVDQHVFPQTIDVLRTRALPLGIQIVTGDYKAFDEENCFGVLIQYPNSVGSTEDYSGLVEKLKQQGIFLCVATDLMALCQLKPPGEWGADVAVGNTQRFGVPLGFGGPHAAFFASTEEFKRQIPGRIIGVSVDKNGDRALRMALQTREQHIKREKSDFQYLHCTSIACNHVRDVCDLSW